MDEYTKEKCPFCERYGARDGQLPLIDKDLRLGDFGQGIVGLYISKPIKGQKDRYMDLRVSLNHVMTTGVIAKVRVAYCCMCGRKLGDLDATKEKVMT